ncbi:hypothetical protein J4573_51915 [Actinomadura barringtoniae]|uniref:DUF1440 domain-containing protein n=1 Tax=Actinomadura barringtoniae TaxID=1427535 RepID=A0A939TA12_9ACTN|nr:hypothetical protein [Actinomadura barringtoniae]MBO2455663.1 hypothetical protein [Actinomadura barringtoniae]
MTTAVSPVPVREGTPTSYLRNGALPGALAGIAGGLVFGGAMASLGALPTVAALVRSDVPWVGFALHMAIAVVVGAVFGLLVVHQQIRSSELLFWGLAYGMFWWFLGTLTLLPLLSGLPMTWSLKTAQASLPSLLGHLYYGAVTAVAFALLHRDGKAAAVAREHLRPRTLLRGLIAAAIVGGLLVLSFGVGAGARLGWLPAVAVCMGIGYPLVFTGKAEGTGPALIRGTAYGFLWWVVVSLTLPPLLDGNRLDWSQPTIAAATTRLPPYLLAGAGIAAIFGWLGGLARNLFVDDVRLLHHETSTRGLRVLAYGALSGLIGGIIFGFVWGTVDVLPSVARLVGAQGEVAGWIVHLVIAQIIGVSYALLFRGRSYDLASGLGWGLSYGFFWWVFGALTLLPVLLGQPPRWNATAIATAFPGLVGHLAYGAGLGAIFAWLEHRENPWWVARSQTEAVRATARRDQVLGSAPALWILTVLIALTIPVLVAPP